MTGRGSWQPRGGDGPDDDEGSTAVSVSEPGNVLRRAESGEPCLITKCSRSGSIEVTFGRTGGRYTYCDFHGWPFRRGR